MSEILKVCGIGLACTFGAAMLGKISGNMALMLRVGGVVVLFGILALLMEDQIAALRDAFSSLDANRGYIEKAFSLMVKALGIAMICRFCSDICRDCGETGIANAVDAVGRIVIFALAIPMLAEILEYAQRILKIGE